MLQWKKHLKQINNYWIFPVLLTIGTVFFILEPSPLTGVAWFYFISRVLCTGDKTIVSVSFLGMLILTISCWQTLNKEQQKKFPEAIEVTGHLSVLPDKFKIDGDRLQLEGSFSQSKKNKRKVIAFYRFTSEQEKQSWQKKYLPIRISLSGEFETPLPQTNLNGFDYRKYLKENGIYQTLSISNMHKIEMENPKFYDVLTLLSSYRKRAIDYCDNTFLKETSLHLKTLIFGFKSSEFSQKEGILANLGILHLFSLSGMHVTFFIGSFRYLLLRCGITIEKLFWLQLLFSIVYAGLTGFSISVVRALMQSIISLSNREFKWRLSGLDCWGLSLIVGLIFQPYLLFSAGGQLSYGLSFFILYVHPIVERINNRYIRMYCFSLLLNITMIPLIGLTFFEWQLTSSLFTFLLLPIFERAILPILTISLLSSFACKIKLLIDVLEIYFVIQQSVFEWLSRYSTFTLVTGIFSPVLFLLTCSSLFLLLHTMSKRSKKAYLIGAGLLFLMNNKYFSPKGTIAFIDVGQGDSIFIQTPFHQENILIDTGGKVDFEKDKWAVKTKQIANADYSVIPYLKSKGVKYLDKVLISHGDMDHCGDLLTINEKIPIRSLYFPVGTEEKPVFRQMLDRLKRKGTRCYPILAGASISRSISLEILAPTVSGTGENKDSMVVYTKVSGRRFLFTGDLEKEGEKQMIKQFPTLKADVLKIGHHGSKTSSDPLFIQTIGLTDGIISCGRNNRFKHPHKETVDTLNQEQITQFHTDKNGMIYYEWTPFTRMSPAKTIMEED
ncbi:DNA internalization-related competence protein ComEC/Rec2 [Enterococcus ureasiticus]|uniref:DNA internalization-related competence protein ComEC/Rec2 n=1 Tax=Enterococcus ureasiticus TaxID=903984 RepID=A0A1E5GMA6_9ENTE|nr:DNA internalization-related competence protein ComEC/Rec2 [Enterococcus ureasiticus]OEG13824.1 DNA internalization-related competence protein ComEC/Rec2 [Enterococcus ureasiticus]